MENKTSERIDPSIRSFIYFPYNPKFRNYIKTAILKKSISFASLGYYRENEYVCFSARRAKAQLFSWLRNRRLYPADEMFNRSEAIEYPRKLYQDWILHCVPIEHPDIYARITL